MDPPTGASVGLARKFEYKTQLKAVDFLISLTTLRFAHHKVCKGDSAVFHYNLML